MVRSRIFEHFFYSMFVHIYMYILIHHFMIFSDSDKIKHNGVNLYIVVLLYIWLLWLIVEVGGLHADQFVITMYDAALELKTRAEIS